MCTVKLNRRNALLALGTIAAGSGTALATGAFSSVNADRTVTINTASDGDAVLSLTVNEEKYNGLSGNGDVIELNFNRLNQNAVTTFVNALTIGNNGSQAVDVTIEPNTPGNVLVFRGVPDDLQAGESRDITIDVDLKAYNAGDAPKEITIRAET